MEPTADETAQTEASAVIALLAAMQATVETHGLFTPGQTVVVGVSGGTDSTALLHALSERRADWNINLVGAHLNHSFRGAEADADAQYVADLCARLQIPCQLRKVDVPGLQKRRHLSAQEAARVARHTFLREVAAQVGAQRIALAHTRDDRIETVLLNLFRGTGLEGLSGFPPMRLPVVRPFYEVSRAQTDAYCAAFSLAPRQDSSNLKWDYRRNRLRAELLPYLAAYYNENIGDAILRMSALAFADNRVLEEQAAHFLDALTRAQDAERILLDTVALRTLPIALQRRVLRQAITQTRGHLQNVGLETLDRLLAALTENRPLQITLPADDKGTVCVRVEEEGVRIYQAEPASLPLPWQIELQLPGRTELPQDIGVIEVWRGQPDAPPFSESFFEGDIHTVQFAAEQLTLPLVARSWRPGDRMRPRGLGGSKKLQDLFTDRKIPAPRRAFIPLIVEAGGKGRILWVVGLASEETSLPIGSIPSDSALTLRAFLRTNKSAHIVETT